MNSNRLAEVLRLTAALSDCVLDAQIMKRPVPDDQVRALADAAQLLRDHDVEWPAMLGQVLHEMAQAAEEPEREAEARNERVKGLTRFLSGFRREKGQS